MNPTANSQTVEPASSEDTLEVPGYLVTSVERFRAGMSALEYRLAGRQVTMASALAETAALCERLKEEFRHEQAIRPEAETSWLGYLTRETLSRFQTGAFNKRAYDKPLGYAGDYWTIEMLYRNQPSGNGPLGKLIDRWTLDLASATAVRNRRRMVSRLIRELERDWLDQRPMPVTSLASGPAKELFDVLAVPAHPGIFATCVDLDDEAIAFARSTAEREGVIDRMRFVRENIIRLAKGRARTRIPLQRLIYSMGLVDYLSDRVVVLLLDWCYDQLQPGGKVGLGNFATGNPDKAFLDSVMDWRLRHRTPAEMRSLFERSKFRDAAVDIHRDETGVQLLAIASKPGGRPDAVGPGL